MELNENWTVYIVGQMHRYRITSADLANRLGWTPSYLSTILNGKKQPKSLEARNRIKARILTALREMIRELLEVDSNG